MRTGAHLEKCIPDPDPLLDFDLSTARTRDYLNVNRTLRYPYFQVRHSQSPFIALRGGLLTSTPSDLQTMAHRPMHINDWIEIDKDYAEYLQRKRQVIEEHGQ